MKILVVIPARSGSKGLPGKNIRLLNNKPLIHYSIEFAQCFFNNQDICFTTNSGKYKNIAEQCGLDIPFLRPESLSTDKSTTQDVLLHALSFYENRGDKYDAVLLLQPTSPFRLQKHLKEIISIYKNDVDMVVSVKETDSNPYYVLVEEDDLGFLQKSKVGNFTRRQDCPKVYEYNGSMYLINVNSLKRNSLSNFHKIKKYEMNQLYSLDIDTILDFKFAELLKDEKLI